MRREKEVYYWKNGGEVDFVVKGGDNSLTAINVSYTEKIEEREVRALEAFSGVEGFGAQVKELLLLTKDTEKTENGIRYMPLWKWILETW